MLEVRAHRSAAAQQGVLSISLALLELAVENGLVERTEGGGGYGDAWRDLLEETRDVQYVGYPRPGLFWFWEAALGTNPKVRRPAKVSTVATGGMEWEHHRAGLLHLGFGTGGPSMAAEHDAAERGLPHGHLQFPTVDITYSDGRQVRTVDHGRLVALDDPEVRAAAARYGNPDEVLEAAWIPPDLRHQPPRDPR